MRKPQPLLPYEELLVFLPELGKLDPNEIYLDDRYAEEPKFDAEGMDKKEEAMKNRDKFSADYGISFSPWKSVTGCVTIIYNSCLAQSARTLDYRYSMARMIPDTFDSSTTSVAEKTLPFALQNGLRGRRWMVPPSFTRQNETRAVLKNGPIECGLRGHGHEKGRAVFAEGKLNIFVI